MSSVATAAAAAAGAAAGASSTYQHSRRTALHGSPHLCSRHVSAQPCSLRYVQQRVACHRPATCVHQQQPVLFSPVAVQKHSRSQQRSLLTRASASSGAAAAAGAQPAGEGSSWFTRVVLPTALVLLVCNMDRICLSVAILPMAQEYGWPATVQVWAVGQSTLGSAFLWMSRSWTRMTHAAGHFALSSFPVFCFSHRHSIYITSPTSRPG